MNHVRYSSMRKFPKTASFALEHDSLSDHPGPSHSVSSAAAQSSVLTSNCSLSPSLHDSYPESATYMSQILSSLNITVQGPFSLMVLYQPWENRELKKIPNTQVDT